MVKQQITAKQNIINKATTLKQYELCDKTQDEMRDLLKQKGKLENQLKEFQKKDTKSKWYQKKKENKEGNSSPKVPLPPKNDKGMKDIRLLFKAKTTASTSATSSATRTVKETPTSNEMTAAITVTDDFTESEEDNQTRDSSLTKLLVHENQRDLESMETASDVSDKEASQKCDNLKIIAVEDKPDESHKDDHLKIIIIEDQDLGSMETLCKVSDKEASHDDDQLKIIPITCKVRYNEDFPTEEQRKFQESGDVSQSLTHDNFLF